MAHCYKTWFDADGGLGGAGDPNGAVLRFWEKCSKLEGLNLNPESRQLVSDIIEALDQMDRFFSNFEAGHDLDASN